MHLSSHGLKFLHLVFNAFALRVVPQSVSFDLDSATAIQALTSAAISILNLDHYSFTVSGKKAVAPLEHAKKLFFHFFMHLLWGHYSYDLSVEDMAICLHGPSALSLISLCWHSPEYQTNAMLPAGAQAAHWAMVCIGTHIHINRCMQYT